MTNVALDNGPVLGDAFGVALLDQFAGLPGVVTYERDDGFVQADGMNYISDWSDRDSWTVARAVGRVLDVGAGAGRVCLRLAETGLDVVALDVSAGAVDVCRRRGVPDVFHGTIDDLPATERFDTFIVLGNNLGLIGSPEKAQGFFDAVGTRLRPDGRIVGGCLDPYQTDDPDHLAYHEANVAAGRMAGEVRLRARYRRLTTAWFGLLWMSMSELAALAQRSGWQVTDSMPGPNYAVVLERAGAS
ncbi:MAG TPA: class I SAM-dependent methyltransferase [Acidimicrobiales bacterium]|nr:class I SAM-dependent methyltransferase [Acidimicrobiales bacterium]